MTEPQLKNIREIQIENEMKDSYLDYAMSVIVARAIPDVRDGLKPVHRRIIYGMDGLNMAPDKPYRKSARLVGDVMGKYHPHGDSAIYDAIVRLAQDFNIRYPLVDGQGNFGSIDGDGAAASRYTEVRMTKLAMEMLRDINKNTVDFEPNFDESEQEPVVLPSRFPNLLVNGASGIAVGMATNMAPHNLREVIDGVVLYMDHPDISFEELNNVIKGPDFPTGALIMGKEGIKQAYQTGRGKLTLRAVAYIEENEEHKGRNRIVITEIPYQVNKSNLIMKIAEYVKEKRIEGISDLRDESGRNGMRIVVELKRDANPNVVLNNLYKYTQLQITFGIINLALVNGVPRVLDLKSLIRHYVDHQMEVITRRCQFELDKAEARAHVVEGLRIAIDNIDEVVAIIRSSKDDAEVKSRFHKRFGLSEIQSQAILDMQLRRLTGLQREKLDIEYSDLIKEIARLKEILANKRLMMNLIKQELIEIRDKYRDKRRTKIKPAATDIHHEELIQEEEVLITLTNHGYIKRQVADVYKVQNRGGKGIVGLTTKEDDFVESLFVTSTHSTLLFFTNQGRVYAKKSYDIPEGKRQAKGQAIINLLPLSNGEKVTAMIPLTEDAEKCYLMMATKNGLLKKTKLKLFQNIRKAGLMAINLIENDELIAVRVSKDENNAFLVTQKGQAIRFQVESIRPIGRSGQGVRGIRLDPDDQVVAMDLVDASNYILLVSEFGYGKKTNLSRYKIQNRGGKGIKTYRVNDKTGRLVSAKLVNMDDEIILVSLKGDIIRLKVKDVSTKGRDTIGVKLKEINREEDKIVAVTKYIEDIEE